MDPQIGFIRIEFLRIRWIERIGLDSEHPYDSMQLAEKLLLSVSSLK